MNQGFPNANQNANQVDAPARSSRNSNNTVHFTSARMAGPATYTPPYWLNGKFFRQKAVFNVYQNDNSGRNSFRITAFGKLADTVAKSCPQGKEVHIDGKLNSYDGRVFVQDANGNYVPLQDQSGAFITTTKIGIVVDSLILGADSAKWIAFEIENGHRPPLWNVPGHADNQKWEEIKKMRNQTQYQIGMNKFGYADVGPIPQGAQAADPATANNARNAGATGNVGTAQAIGNTQQVQSGFQGAGQNTGGGFAGQSNQGGQTVQVNGQSMGYTYGGQTQQASGFGGQTPSNGGSQVVM